MKALSKNRIMTAMVALVVFIAALCTYSTNVGAVNTICQYYYYDAQTAEYQGIYTLFALPSIDNSRSIVETDNRYEDWSKSGVVKIIGGNNYRGTGFVIDQHTIATAAHCVYYVNEEKDEAYPYEITGIYLFDAKGNVTLQATPVQYHVPQIYVGSAPKYNALYDYALITVEEDLSDYMCFNLGVPLDSIADLETEVKITGFPQRVDFEMDIVNASVRHNMYTSNGEVTGITERQIISHNFTSGGNSGGPLYIEETRCGNIYNTVIGIFTSGAGTISYSTRVTTNLIHFYYNNDWIEW